MNLGKKKNLAAKTLGVGKERIVFLKPRLDEIKEAITRQDIKDLKKEGAIVVKVVKGRKKINKKKKKGTGKIKKKINKRKKEYVILTRKLRKYIAGLKKIRKLNSEEVIEIRKKIRNKFFKSKAHLKKYIGGLEKWKFKNEDEENIKQIMERE